MTSKRRAASKSSAARKRRGSSRRRWSRHVTEHSDALTLDKGVFTSRDPKQIAASLKRSAAALSMLTFYINRADKNLPASRKRTLMRAKDELRKQFGKA
jgi:Protein of unknown function (DUF3175)